MIIHLTPFWACSCSPNQVLVTKEDGYQLLIRPEFPKGRKGVGSAGCVREGQRGLVVTGFPPVLLNWKLLSLFFHGSQGNSCSGSHSVTGNLWSRLRISCLPWPTTSLLVLGRALSLHMYGVLWIYTVPWGQWFLDQERRDASFSKNVPEYPWSCSMTPQPLSRLKQCSPSNSPFIWQAACIDRYACSPCANQSSPPLILVVDAHLHVVPVLLRALSPPTAVSSLGSRTYHLFLFVYFYCGKI